MEELEKAIKQANKTKPKKNHQEHHPHKERENTQSDLKRRKEPGS